MGTRPGRKDGQDGEMQPLEGPSLLQMEKKHTLWTETHSAQQWNKKLPARYPEFPNLLFSFYWVTLGKLLDP
jgi:hypothetical protein